MNRTGLLVLSFAMVLRAAAPLYTSTSDSAWKAWSAVRGTAQSDSAVKREGRTSLRVESANGSDAIIRSAAVTLRTGKHYELSGWARSEGLSVEDTGRSPIAAGAVLSMGSMPFDVHSESIAGSRDWTRLRLRFTATRSQDHILLRVAEGGTFRGKAWFEGLSIEEVAAGDEPHRESVKTFGPAYRYPSAGWIYLHIEGKPYERGYQHGYLMPKEIERYVDRCASQLDPTSRRQAWDNGRVTADALFLRGFDDEIREEMKGIADGAAAAGAKVYGRNIDLIDVLTANTIVELGDLRSALRITKNGLEGIGFQMPGYGSRANEVPPNDRCSAFAATGKATRDGKMIVAHTTWWSLTLAEQTNVMLDIRPEHGHRMLMQSYPGGIESGTDWYQNDAGMVLTETTIRQSPFNGQGTPVAYRARKAIQYGGNVDEVVEHLKTKNNGLYTNEWIIGDGKNDEIAMIELGTYKTKLWRSSKNEWFGGTEGFYWGCNNAKDIDVRLEYLPDSKGRPEDITFWPSIRDVKWRDLYRANKGQIDEQFAFLAMRTAPLVSDSAMDAKIATGEMANNLMMWAAIGKPNQRERLASPWDKAGINEGLYPSGYKLFLGRAAAPESAGAARPENSPPAKSARIDASKLWSGWILPADDPDVWLTAGSARYYQILRSDDPAKGLERARVSAREALSAGGDQPMVAVKMDPDSAVPNRILTFKGVLLLDSLRTAMGDERFFEGMRRFYDENTTKRVSTEMFRAAMERAAGRPLGQIFDPWLNQPGIPGDPGGPSRLGSSISFDRLLIVYGTMAEAGANRYAAEQFRLHDFLENSPVLKKDFEVTEADLEGRDVVFIGRPAANQALKAIQSRIGLHYDGDVFQVNGANYASEYDALEFAAPNPADPRRTVLVVAGNSALETVKAAKAGPQESAVTVFRSGKAVQ